MMRDLITEPDARRSLHGFTTPAGIVWRDLSNTARPAWVERRADVLARAERAAAELSMLTPGTRTTAEVGWRPRGGATVGVVRDGDPVTAAALALTQPLAGVRSIALTSQ